MRWRRDDMTPRARVVTPEASRRIGATSTRVVKILCKAFYPHNGMRVASLAAPATPRVVARRVGSRRARPASRATAPRASTSAVDRAYEACGEYTRESSATFYFATTLMRPRQRRSVWAIYAWCRVLDETVDGVEAADEGSAAASERLRAIESRLIHLFDDDAGPSTSASNPETLALADTIRVTPGMRPEPFLDMIRGMRSDLEPGARFKDWPALREYCYRVAGTVGLMTLPVMGVAEGYAVEDAIPAGVDLGIALQLCNIIRDVGEDARRGRLYLPLDAVSAAGLEPEEIFRGVNDERYAALMESQMALAEEHFARAREGTKMLAPAARLPVLAAAEIYGALLDKVRENGYDNHTRRAYTTTGEKLAKLPGLVGRAWFAR